MPVAAHTDALAAQSPQPPLATAVSAAAVQPQPPQPPARFPIRILDTSGREYTIDAGSPQATVAAVREQVAAATGVPPLLQRLIYCGKMLTDAQTLEEVGVVSPNVVVHLFARPAPPAGSVGGGAGAGAGQAGSAEGGGGVGPGIGMAGGWMASFGDPELIRSTHSVRLLSSCLVAVCTMQLLLLFLRLMAQWQGLDDGGGGGQQPAGGDDDADGRQPTNVEDSSAMLFLQVRTGGPGQDGGRRSNLPTNKRT